MQLSLGFRALRLQACGKVVRYVEGQTHRHQFNPAVWNGNGGFARREGQFENIISPVGVERIADAFLNFFRPCRD
jgi:hypothetical protein